ncbi:uncharacterized protein LOC126895929, partial [Daktulosphaira vitifoliae]|uniref:uncharacterized protein LOC126895929 n=1 Tax=Daktulosphaira vitifoliae TaxID=58002 RepID=UPI0021A9C72A
MDFIIKIAEMNFYLGLFIVLVSLVNNLNEAEETSSKDITNDKVCIICHEEKTSVSFNNCVHKMCNSCANGVLHNYYKKCPICKKINTIIIGIQPDTDNICYTCGNEPLTVDIDCKNNHKMGNNCAYRALNVLNIRYVCPYCNLKNRGYKNLHEPKTSPSEVEICVCKSEPVTHILMPCYHRIGSICSYYIPEPKKHCYICRREIVKCLTIEEYNKIEAEKIEKTKKAEEDKKAEEAKK